MAGVDVLHCHRARQIRRFGQTVARERHLAALFDRGLGGLRAQRLFPYAPQVVEDVLVVRNRDVRLGGQPAIAALGGSFDLGRGNVRVSGKKQPHAAHYQRRGQGQNRRTKCPSERAQEPVFASKRPMHHATPHDSADRDPQKRTDPRKGQNCRAAKPIFGLECPDFTSPAQNSEMNCRQTIFVVSQAERGGRAGPSWLASRVGTLGMRLRPRPACSLTAPVGTVFRAAVLRLARPERSHVV